jgi:uncharacterized membrane protein
MAIRLGPLEVVLVFVTLFIMAVPIVLIFALVRFLVRRGGRATKSDAVSLAKERYAKGEISKAEFEEIIEALDLTNEV